MEWMDFHSLLVTTTTERTITTSRMNFEVGRIHVVEVNHQPSNQPLVSGVRWGAAEAEGVLADRDTGCYGGSRACRVRVSSCFKRFSVRNVLVSSHVPRQKAKVQGRCQGHGAPLSKSSVSSNAQEAPP